MSLGRCKMWNPFRKKTDIALKEESDINTLIWDAQDRLFCDDSLLAQVEDFGLDDVSFLASGYRTKEAAKQAAEEGALA